MQQKRKSKTFDTLFYRANLNPFKLDETLQYCSYASAFR